jgi:hypothetical protein
MKNPTWTVEKLQGLSRPELVSLRANALAKNVDDLVALCDAEMEARPAAARVARAGTKAPQDKGETVLEYHFVCPGNAGVKVNLDETFWTTGWVISEDVLRRSLPHHPRLALHETRKDMSYRQGLIVEYRRSDEVANGVVTRKIDLRVEPEIGPMKWAGTGTGDKGYKKLAVPKKMTLQ